MAVAHSNLTSGFDDSNATSYTTASVTPSSDALVLITIGLIDDNSNQPTMQGVTGNGLTWVLVDSNDWDTAGGRRGSMFVYRAMGSSPTAGAITIDNAGTVLAATWSVDEFTNVDTSGTNGSGAVVQSVDNSNGGDTSLSITLAAFGDTDNATFGGMVAESVPSITPGSGFTEITEVASATPDMTLQTQWKTTNDTTVDWTLSTSELAGGVAIEIKESGIATTTFKPQVLSY